MPPPPRRARQSRARKPNNKTTNAPSKEEQEKKEKEQEETLQRASLEKFESHRQTAKESIQKLLVDLDDSSSEEEDHLDQPFKTQSTCVVCLEKVRSKDSIWQCDQCFCLLHLPCTQRWARSCYCEETDGNEDENGYWACPKCRMLYPRSYIPRKYLCFCGKVENPKVDHWIQPHSCGDICRKELKPNCGHSCNARCHPGACPPCPQTVHTKCYCGSDTSSRRCNDRFYSCGNVCNKLLACNVHRCAEKCHSGDCPPCSKTRMAICECGASEALINCAIGDYHCDRVCGKLLSCGNHNCEKICHSGECESCPLEGNRDCHCGKVTFDELQCTDPTPSCGDTCNKPLNCYGNHNCNQRCHPGECSKCRQLISKYCICRQSKKKVQCYQEFSCDKRCSKLRDCKRHQCKKKCCTECPPCNEICGRKLGCGNHRCEAICHPYACFPCPVTVDIYCFCKSNKITVPCGAEAKTKPPKCRENCPVPPTCHHESRTPHPCHFEECPPCKQICNVSLPGCLHKCPKPCHDPIPAWPTNPKKRKNFDPMRQRGIDESSVVCDSCEEQVNRQCFGLHAQYEVPCHTDRLFDCKRICGNPLACGNHSCQLPCHIVTNPRDERIYIEDTNDIPPLDEYKNFKINVPCLNGKKESIQGIPKLDTLITSCKDKYRDTCTPCPLPCQKKRNPPCKHPCTLACHPGDCPPCETLVRKYCHCPLNTLKVIKCCETHISKEEMDKFRSCGMECTKKLSCGHTCKLQCHAGPCRPVEECQSKVRVSCKCRHRKVQKFPCSSAPKQLECNESCEEYAEEQKRKKEEEEKRKKMAATTIIDKSMDNNPQKRKKRNNPKPKNDLSSKKKEPNALIVKCKSAYNTITSPDTWKVIFVYSLPFLFLSAFVFLALLK